MVVFKCRLFANLLKYREHQLKKSGKQDSFRYISKSSASMYESSGSQFFRTTTGIQSGPDVFDESGFAMTFLTILGVAEILCSFRLVLKGITGKRDTTEFEIMASNQHLSGKCIKRMDVFL